MIDIFKGEINFLKSSWQNMLGRPLVVMPLKNAHLGTVKKHLKAIEPGSFLYFYTSFFQITSLFDFSFQFLLTFFYMKTENNANNDSLEQRVCAKPREKKIWLLEEA